MKYQRTLKTGSSQATCKTPLDKTKWLIVGVYFNAHEEGRTRLEKKLARTLLDLRECYHDFPVIVTGDWNLDPSKMDTLLATYGALDLARVDFVEGEYTWTRITEGRIVKKKSLDHFAISSNAQTPNVHPAANTKEKGPEVLPTLQSLW